MGVFPLPIAKRMLFGVDLPRNRQTCHTTFLETSSDTRGPVAPIRKWLYPCTMGLDQTTHAFMSPPLLITLPRFTQKYHFFRSQWTATQESTTAKIRWEDITSDIDVFQYCQRFLRRFSSKLKHGSVSFFAQKVRGWSIF